MEDGPINVCIVEDNHGTRASVAAVITQEAAFRCAATYATGEAALEGIPAIQPDIALVDIHLPGMDGIELIGRLKLKLPALEMVILTNYENGTLIFNALRAGASGYLLKNAISEELIAAMQLVLAGGAPMSLQIARKVAGYFRHAEKSAPQVETLTGREREILELLSKGLMYKEVAAQLGIALNTMRSHIRNIYKKLQVQSRNEAMLKFLGQ